MIVDLAEVTLEDLADCVVVVVRGQLDLATLEPLYAALAFAYQDRAADLVVDFEGVTFCGAETLRLLSDTAVRFSIGGRRLVVRGAQPTQARLFGICRLEHLLTPLKKLSWAEPETS
jgi:anti-anti-sigma factor